MPDLSVIIAARNASSTLGRCLDAVCRQADAGTEVIVVDDASSDETATIARRFPVQIRAAHHRLGAAGARNHGAAAARGAILLFLDADVVAGATLLADVRRALAAPGVDGVIGSYDDRPAARTVVSLFKNLAHHHVHLASAGPVTTFWAACGAVRRDRFVAVGGFDQRRFLEPSIEDVELGWRLTATGARIRLDPTLRVTHLKRWTLGQLIRTDVVRRAIPWAALARERGRLQPELNVAWRHRLAATLAWLIVVLMPVSIVWPPGRAGLAGAVVAAALVNASLFRLFLRVGGPRLLVGGFALQQLYYVYAALGFAVGVVAVSPPAVARPTELVRETPRSREGG